MPKQLNADDRKKIRIGLDRRDSFKTIALFVGKHCSSITREVRSHLVIQRSGACGQNFNDCANRFGCDEIALCDNDLCRGGKCRNCYLLACSRHCENYERQSCLKLEEPPYVCNGCPDRRKCTLEKHVYDPKAAQQESDAVRSESRSGTHLSPKELAHVRNVAEPLLKQGLSPHHIWAAEKDTLMVSERTLYNMIDDGILSDCATDLHQKVSRKPVKPRHKTQNHVYKVDPNCKQGRHYEEYLVYMDEHPGIPRIEMDTVEGEKGGKVILTIHFLDAQFMLAFLRQRNDARGVREVFDDLTRRLGLETFKKLFPVILTDNGSEFSDPTALEIDPDTGEQRTRIFYCHPNASFEKGQIEQNHRMLRYVLPKRKSSFEGLTQEKVNLLVCHVNSYLRLSTSDVASFDLFKHIFDPDEKIIRALEIAKVAPRDVFLRPALLKRV